ncbi:MAG: TSUP family transporter [Methyloprofundus sp.]|nr:TSUP family transporter [Methyloprofundus sp.]
MNIIDYWYAFPVGLLISSLVSSVGIGGGVLWMPFFLIVLKLSPETAVLTSLVIQTAGMGSASLMCARQKRVDKKMAGFILLISLPGVLIGSILASRLESEYMQLALGLLVMTTAFLFVSSKQKYADMGKESVDMRQAYRSSWITFPASIGSGMLSTSMSEWLIPIMRSKLSLKMSHAIGTSIVIAFGVSAVAAVIHLFLGSKPEIGAVIWAVPGVLIGGQIGPRITAMINERLLKESFVFFLTLVGIHLVYNAY